MEDKEKVFVICVNISANHLPEAINVICYKCGKDLWCDPNNLDKTPICIDCLKEFKNIKNKNVNITINLADIVRAVKYYVKGE